MEPHHLLSLAFGLLGLLSAASVLFGLPGAWILIAIAAGLELLSRTALEAGPLFGWWPLLGAVAVAGIAELIELIAGWVGVKGAGGSRRGAVGAFVGGLVGAVLGTVGLPVPLLGTLIGALVGTFVGAFLGETVGKTGRSSREALAPALGATLARLLATVAKVFAALAAWAGLLVAALL